MSKNKINFEFPSVFSVTCHTKHVGPGSTFVAIPGENQHGQAFIQEALDKGATTIVVDPTFTDKKIPGITYIHVENAHTALAQLSAKALGFPGSKLYTIGITGTKGKTTTCSLLFHLLQTAGIKTALISSVENKIDTLWSEKSLQTTPTADYIQMFCAQAVAYGITHLIIETSSHALFYNKLIDLPLSVAGFTNFDQDHLDFHKTIEHYFATKMKIFSLLTEKGNAFINDNDARSENIIKILKSNHPTVTYTTVGSTAQADEHYTIVQSDLEQTSLSILNNNFHSKELIGTFNAQNMALAIIIAHTLNIAPEQIQSGLASFKAVAGRAEKFLFNNKQVIIDFAHNPSSMESILSSLAPHTKQLIVLFGCGGNRDPFKRPLMGTIAAKYGTTIIITNDNPRNEDPQTIARDIIQGIPTSDQHKIILELDREAAIKHGLELLNPHGILVILGRGHETHQLIDNKKIPFHDATVVAKLSRLT